MTLVGSEASREAAHRSIEDLLNQRVLAEQGQQQGAIEPASQMEIPTTQPMQASADVPSTQPFDPQTAMPGTATSIAGTTPVPTMPSIQDPPNMTSVLQLSNDFISLLYEEDITQMQQDIGCGIEVMESELGGLDGGWTITLFG